MDREFHYDITYILAKKSGFSKEDAAIIAYASQYTDDNNKIITVKRENEEEYKNYISQTMNILKPINKLVRIYSCFHFFPGDFVGNSAKRIDGSLHLLNTTPNSGKVKKIFEDALVTKNLYRIGIATHCYADTWAHQNFIGFKHVFSSMKLKNWKKVIPDIGHGEAEHKPDIPSLEWEDARLVNGKINNKERFIEASKEIFYQYCKYNRTNFEEKWGKLKKELRNAIGQVSSDVKKCSEKQSDRLRKYKMIEDSMPEFCEEKWIEEAIDIKWSKIHKILLKIKFGEVLAEILRKKRKVKLIGKAKKNFINSNWYKFQEAVKEHQESIMKILMPIYEQMGFDKSSEL